MARPTDIDWQGLATRLGTLRAGGEVGGSDLARLALADIVGDDAWSAAVDHYVARRPGSELARSVLWLIRPAAAADRCVQIFREGALHDRRTAVELFRVLATGQHLPLVRTFLDDPDRDIQTWGAGVLDQLAWEELVEPDEIEALLAAAEAHGNEHVREKAAFIRSFLAGRSRALEAADDEEPATPGDA